MATTHPDNGVIALTEEPPAEDDPAPETDPPDPDQAWKALSLVNDWIRHAEAKTGASLTAAGVSGGLLYNLVKGKPDLPVPVNILAAICGGSAFLAIVCAAVALMPRTTPKFLNGLSRKNRPTPDDWSNLLFYSHIAKKYKEDEPSYQEVFTALTLNKLELTKHIANQVWANSAVAHRKFKWSTRSIFFLTITVISLGFLVALFGAKVI